MAYVPGKTVLFVMHDLMLMKIYESRFVVEGYSVLKESGAEMGLKSALVKKPNIIILENDLGQLSTEDFLSKLRGNKATETIPVIVITTKMYAQNLEKTTALRISSILNKEDITPSELVNNVKMFI